MTLPTPETSAVSRRQLDALLGTYLGLARLLRESGRA